MVYNILESYQVHACSSVALIFCTSVSFSMFFCSRSSRTTQSLIPKKEGPSLKKPLFFSVYSLDFPGTFVHVIKDGFTMSENEWVTVEEQLVHIETSGLLLKSNSVDPVNIEGEEVIHLVGLETAEPVLQIGRQIFAGTYVDAPETSVFFRCTPSSHPDNPVDPAFPRPTPKISAKLECKTNKKLNFKRIFLKPKAKS